MIDSVDVQILTILQSDARTSNAAIARHVGLTPSAILERIRKLQATGAGRALAAIPEVQEVHNIAGEDCYLVKVRVKDAEALGELLRHKIGPIEKVRRTRTTIVMSSPLEAGRLPLEQALDGNGGGDGDG
jgi:Lrp/AsnC family leucine-responsive transcriptional regulator